MKQYHDLLNNVLKNGTFREDRTGTGTYSIFGTQTRYNLEDEFPLVTTKKVHMKSIFWELVWFLKGETNNNWLKEKKVSIWNEWAKEDGSLGPVYGKQWRRFQSHSGKEVDQIKQVLTSLKENPDSRRHIVSAWQPAEIEDMALPPCHAFFQFYVRKKDGKTFLDCQLYQRSADLFLGVPFNIASYSLLVYLFSEILGYTPGEFIHTIGDAHIYSNHIEQVKKQLSREPKAAPKLEINKTVTSLEDLENLVFSDIRILDYEPYPGIKAPVAV